MELIAAVSHLGNQVVGYVVTFFVLGIRWTSISRLIDEEATIDRPFVMWSIFHLFLITCMPFSTMVVGRYIQIPAAAWLYAANTAAAALVVMILVRRTEPHARALYRNEIFLSMVWLLFVVLLSMAASFFDTALAMWLYALNILPALFLRRLLPRHARRR